MIFGNRPTHQNSALALLVCVLFTSGHVGFGAESWSIGRLAEALAQSPREQVRFEERRFMPALEDPIVLKGYLKRPNVNRLEKHVQEPVRETFVIDGDTATISDSGGETARFDIAEYPVLHALTTAMRSLLNGQLEDLDEHFELELTGTAASWQLELNPRDATARAGLAVLRFNGRGGSIRRIEMIDMDRGHSILELLPPT